MDTIYDVAIIGGGIAGFEAALALKNFKRNVLWIGRNRFGEKLAAAESVRNFPSFSGSGEELCRLLSLQSEREKIPFTSGRIDGVYRMGEEYLLACGEENYRARAVILATGVEAKGPLAGEREFLGRGVSYCAVCDGALYKGKRIAAVLSSGEYEEEAEFLAGFAEKVYCLCLYRDPHFRARNLEIVSSLPAAIEGTNSVEGLRLKDGSVLEVSGIFFLRNSAPPSALVGGLGTTEDGHVRVNRAMETEFRGLFAAGDVTGRPYQYVKAAGEGLVAAFSANAYLDSLLKKEGSV